LSPRPNVRSSEATVRAWSSTLTCYMFPNHVPRHVQPIALTVAGCRHVEGPNRCRARSRGARSARPATPQTPLRPTGPGPKPNVSPGQPFLPAAPKCVGPLRLTSRACVHQGRRQLVMCPWPRGVEALPVLRPRPGSQRRLRAVAASPQVARESCSDAPSIVKLTSMFPRVAFE
jgi:hypothetical protein